jgi:formylglycine-generating enzyme required for sulfatase activity
MVHLKKSSASRRSHESSGLKRFMIMLLTCVGCAAILGLFWFFSQLGPKKVDYRKLNTNFELTTEVNALREQSIESEARFEEVLAIRSPEPEDILLLRRALDLQRQYIDAVPGYQAEASQRLEDLEKRYQDMSAEHLKLSSLEMESEALKLVNDKLYEAARDKYKEALDIQTTINENYPLSSAYDVGRAARLRRQARYLAAEPLLQQSLVLEDKADAFIVKQEWDSASNLLTRAIQIQQQLNREYRGTNQSSVSRLERLKVKQVGVDSGENHLEIEQVSSLADTRHVEGETLQAANLYEEAARLQKQLNEEYPESPYASSERVAEFQRKSETAQSFELGVEIEKNHDLLKNLLSERRTHEAAEVIVGLRRAIQRMQETFPRSSLNDEELQVKVRYLNLVQSDLGYIQDRVYAALLPVPKVEGVRMLRTEVPQALYSLMMGTNPSRHQGDVNPVESVSWTEAKSFCERLSWVLGKHVRLPTENEFRQALGGLRYVKLEEHVWSVSFAEGVAQPVGQKEAFGSGFHDLLGNVSEWLESIDRFESEAAIHIGGHAQDRIETLFTVPMRNYPRGERNRLTGFRVVVLVD